MLVRSLRISANEVLLIKTANIKPAEPERPEEEHPYPNRRLKSWINRSRTENPRRAESQALPGQELLSRACFQALSRVQFSFILLQCLRRTLWSHFLEIVLKITTTYLGNKYIS